MIKRMNHLMRQRALRPPLASNIILTNQYPPLRTKSPPYIPLTRRTRHGNRTSHFYQLRVHEYYDGGFFKETVDEGDALGVLAFLGSCLGGEDELVFRGGRGGGVVTGGEGCGGKGRRGDVLWGVRISVSV
jgi:hypothetical protein